MTSNLDNPIALPSKPPGTNASILQHRLQPAGGHLPGYEFRKELKSVSPRKHPITGFACALSIFCLFLTTTIEIQAGDYQKHFETLLEKAENEFLQIQNADIGYQCPSGDNCHVLNNSNIREGAVCVSIEDEVIPGKIKGKIKLDPRRYLTKKRIARLLSVLNSCTPESGQNLSILP